MPDERFQSVCVELRQALSREQEAQMLIQEQSNQLHTLQRRVDENAAEQAETQRTLRQTGTPHTNIHSALFEHQQVCYLQQVGLGHAHTESDSTWV